MKLHANARTCPNSRALIGTASAPSEVVARGGGRGRRRAASRPRASGSSAPARATSTRSTAHRAPAAALRGSPSACVQAIAALRRLWMTAAEIAEILGLALSTVSLWLRRLGLGKRSRLSRPSRPTATSAAIPGELVHVDIKQLGRISARGAGHRMLGHRKASSSAATVGTGAALPAMSTCT